MSDLNKLKELAERCDSMCASVDLHAAYSNFITYIEPKDVVALFNQLEAVHAECVRLDRESQNLSTQLGGCDRLRLEAQQRVAELQSEAEREGGITIDAMDSMREWRLRAETAEAEIARRDKAVGEPPKELANLEHFIAFWRKVKDGAMKPCANDIDHTVWFMEGLSNIDAQPSALPPEVDSSDVPRFYQGTWQEEDNWVAGANWMREKAKALGCKPITLPKIKHPAQFDYADEVIAMLREQGFTVEGGNDD